MYILIYAANQPYTPQGNRFTKGKRYVSFYFSVWGEEFALENEDFLPCKGQAKSNGNFCAAVPLM